MLTNIKRIIQFYKLLNKDRLVKIFVGGLLVSTPVIFNIIYPLLIMNILNVLENTKSIDLNSIVLLGVSYTVAFILSYAGDLVYIKNKYLASQEMRNQIFYKFLYFPANEFKKRGSGYFATLINEQVNNAFVVLDYMFVENIFLLFRTIVILGIVFTWNKILFLIFLANTLLVMSYSEILNKVIRGKYVILQDLARKLTSFIAETFKNIHEVIAGRAIESRNCQFREVNNQIANLAIQAEKTRISLDKIMTELPKIISKFSIILYCAYLYIHGKITIGFYLAIITYFDNVVNPMAIFKTFSKVFLESSVTISSILDYYAQIKSIKDTYIELDEQTISSTDIISVNNLSLERDNHKILNNISFSLHAKDTLGLMGLSGEGKSSLLNILLGFERTYLGEVKFMGVEVRRISPKSLFEKISVYSQSVGLFNQTLEENIVMGRELNLNELDRLVSELKLDHLRGRNLGEDGSMISGGEKQKVQFARFLYSNCPFFILDEPFTNIDLINEKVLVDRLKSYIEGKTGFIISHKINILKVASKCMVLENGKAVDIGDFKYLLDKNDLSRELYNIFLENARSTEIK